MVNRTKAWVLFGEKVKPTELHQQLALLLLVELDKMVSDYN
jgi:hypothetical protein